MSTRLPLIVKLGFLILGLQITSSTPSLYSLKSLVQYLLLFNYLMVRKSLAHIGTIQVTSTLVLENFLCVPSFSFNLISISKLTKSLSCCLVFLSNFCSIQDLSYWKMIGVGKLHNNLYLLQASTNYKFVSGVSSIL